jgi:aminopeptidase YwaD
VYDTTKHLSVDIGPRVAGTDGEKQARDFIEQALRSYGYAVSEQPFPFDATAYLPARVNAGADGFPAIAFKGSAAGSATGQIVVAGIGASGDVPPTARGNIALMKRGGVPFTEMVDNAVRQGAAGVIIYNNQPGSIVGEADAVGIPVVSLTQAAGQQLADSAAAAPTTVTVTVSPPRGTAYNVIAKPPGTTDCRTVTGGHYDSVPVTGGADDNASGAASVIEVARLAAARKLGGANCFVLFGGEEFGLFGSKAFVAGLTPAQLNTVRAMLNLDVVGVTTPLGLVGDADLVEQARVQAQRAGVTAEPSSLPPGASSDHAIFRDAGVPVVMFTREDDDIHTTKDAMDRISADSLRDSVTAAYATLASLQP